MTPDITPTSIDLKRDERLTVIWQDGKTCTYSLSLLRTMCPCAMCKLVREGSDPHQLLQPKKPEKKVSLTLLPGNFSEPLRAVGAELVGNYAIRIDWSDQHSSGIYSFKYLRDICPA